MEHIKWLPKDVKTDWLVGKLTFNDLLKSHHMDHQELGEALGLRMPKHIVAVRHTMEDWQRADDRRIHEARNRYDSGFVEMVQGRTSYAFILYSIPRKNRIVRERTYFRGLLV